MKKSNADIINIEMLPKNIPSFPPNKNQQFFCLLTSNFLSKRSFLFVFIKSFFKIILREIITNVWRVFYLVQSALSVFRKIVMSLSQSFLFFFVSQCVFCHDLHLMCASVCLQFVFDHMPSFLHMFCKKSNNLIKYHFSKLILKL